MSSAGALAALKKVRRFGTVKLVVEPFPYMPIADENLSTENGVNVVPSG